MFHISVFAVYFTCLLLTSYKHNFSKQYLHALGFSRCHNWLFDLISQGVPEQKLRSHLGSLGVTGNLALQPMYTLSGIFGCLEFYDHNILDAAHVHFIIYVLWR